jgi:hypothetical protein
MNGKVTIQSAIDELQRNFNRLNDAYFGGELERPVITILADSTSGAYGWISVNKVWSSKDNQWYREINLCAEYLNRPTELVITTLLHEMCHLFNIQHNIQDTSRGGTYHNAKFKETAEMCGLIVGKSEKYGFCITMPSPELTELVNETTRTGCFKLERIKTYRNGTPKTTTTGEDGKERTTSRTKQSMKKYNCPVCGLIVRASKDIAGKLLCVDCSELFVES